MKVTIAIPFYNAEPYLKLAITSVLNQSFQDFELILIDDGSTDNSLEIARRFENDKVIVLSDSKNKGLPTRLNEIVDLANGDYIARMDADDFISKDRLQKQYDFLEKNTDVDIVSTGVCSIDNNNKVIAYRLPRKVKSLNFNIHDGINGATDIAHATIMARKSWCCRNRYNESARLMEDYQLWIEAIANKDLNVGFINEPLYFYREESSINYKKLIKAYRNQKLLIAEDFLDQISSKAYYSFVLKINIKIFITMLFNKVGLLNTLLIIRNRNTPQDSSLLNKLQASVSDFTSK